MKTPKNPSKTEKIVILILAAVLLLAAIIGIFGFVSSSYYRKWCVVSGCVCDFMIARLPPLTTSNVNVYLSGEYKEYTAGDKAAEYFPTPEELGDYESIAFYYADNSYKREHEFEVSDLFVLDVRYDEALFEEKLYAAFLSYVEGRVSNAKELYLQERERIAQDEYRRNNMNELVELAIVTPSAGCEIQNAKDKFILGFDVDDHIVRYIFGCGISKGSHFSDSTDYYALEYPPAKSE